ncbi:MAG: SPOR domain-containing protein [Bacteroidetes bacterium]|jgi:hypothetical protein|nr:SPOR domain-containing protein [Bacteroidota bacterium]
MLGHLQKTLILLLTAIAAAGCGGGEEATRQAAPTAERQVKKEPKKHPLSYYESTLRPSMFDADVDSVRRVHEEERERQTLEIPRDSLVLEQESILGFRIQIASSASIDDAGAVRMAAQGLFLSDSVYVVYDPPVYKVRIGDFMTRLEANQRLPQLQEGGYPDAWVVPDKVVRRKWVPVVRPE